ncbi:MAG: anthranilate phosphoribosyltransferase [Phycisphaeraceae bacterium]|nr:MAG: anthranilate phosphoribosyltransferase [Phycisphaeraceae bacterium]
MHDLLTQLVHGATLTEAQAEHAFETILTGGANEVQVGAMLALMARRGPTIEEIVGGARAMRRHATIVPTEGLEEVGALIDTCGTGGAAKTFNISTAAAVVAAAARGRRRVLVAKHGGRSRSGRGSAEALEALGVNVAATPESQRRCLEEAGVCFCFAIHHHPAMKFAAGPRKSLGFPTIFNLLGPLTNPAMAPRQLMGVYDRAYVATIAEALRRLGCERAMVVRGEDGMDEISTTAPTFIAHLREGRIETKTMDAAAMGVPRATMADLQQVDDIEKAADLVSRVLSGEKSPARDIVTLNAAAAIVVGDGAETFEDGIAMATEAIDSGTAKDTLAKLAELSHRR